MDASYCLSVCGRNECDSSSLLRVFRSFSILVYVLPLWLCQGDGIGEEEGERKKALVCKCVICLEVYVCACECVRTSDRVYVCQANAVSQRNSGAQL